MRASTVPASLLAILVSTVLAAAPVHAKDHGEGHGKGNKHENSQGRDDDDGPGKGRGHKDHEDRRDLPPGAYFNDSHREVVRTYYTAHPGRDCPPGLAKKHNGCLPPGQAKKQWEIGRPLPPTVVVTPVPQVVLVKLPPAPVGYRYVQANNDVLLIAAGTKMVVDGISGLLR